MVCSSGAATVQELLELVRFRRPVRFVRDVPYIGHCIRCMVYRGTVEGSSYRSVGVVESEVTGE